MRRSASEIIRNLEMRIARLEKTSAKIPKYKLRQQQELKDFIAFCREHGLKKVGDVVDTNDPMFVLRNLDKFKMINDYEATLTRKGEEILNENKDMRVARLENQASSSNRKTASSTLKLDSKTLLTVENAIAEKFQYEEEYNGIEVGDVNCFNRVELTSNRGQSLIVVNCELHYTDDEGEEHSEDQSWSIELEEDISNVVGPLTNPYFIFELIRDAVRNIDNLSQD